MTQISPLDPPADCPDRHQWYFDKEAAFRLSGGGAAAAAEAERTRAAGKIRQGMRVRVVSVAVSGRGPSEHIGRVGTVHEVVERYVMFRIDLDPKGRAGARRVCLSARQIEALVEPDVDPSQVIPELSTASGT